jgi:hypothetical protein
VAALPNHFRDINAVGVRASAMHQHQVCAMADPAFVFPFIYSSGCSPMKTRRTTMEYNYRLRLLSGRSGGCFVRSGPLCHGSCTFVCPPKKLLAVQHADSRESPALKGVHPNKLIGKESYDMARPAGMGVEYRQ